MIPSPDEPAAPLAAGSSSDLTSVQHLETTVLLLACQTACQQHLHARHWTEREAVYSALAAAADGRFIKRCHRIHECCAFPVIWINADGQPSTSLGRCRDRLCPLCSAARARESGDRVEALLATMDAPRFLTLTVPHRQRDLRVQLDQVMQMFRELRKTESWRHYVKGGVWSLEITRNQAAGEWHPHIHVVFDGAYFPQAELKAEWTRIVGENTIVDVRAVNSRRAAARYIAKYVSKSLGLGEWTEAEIREYADATHRRRTIHTFGACHGVSTEADPPETPPTKGAPTVGVWVLRRRVRLGDELARRHTHALASAGGVLRMLLSDCGDEREYLSGDQLEKGVRAAVAWLKTLDPANAANWSPPTPPQPPGRKYKDRTPPLITTH